MTPRILIIAGSDSGGGAGIQADIKTVTMLGGHAMTAVTAITAQNTLGVSAIHPIPTDMVLAQIDAVLDDIGVDAVKIGMIGSADTAAAVATRLEALLDVPVVFDPVMVATSGAVLADEASIAAFERLSARATLVTPNAPELARLAGMDVSDEYTQQEAAEAFMHRTGAKAVLGKGGHLNGPFGVTDTLYVSDSEGWQEWFWEADRLETPHTHGTGCTLASAIATGLARKLSLQEAIADARLFVRLAIREAPGFGAGHGPMGHQAVRLDLPFGGTTLNQITLPLVDYAASHAFYEALGLTPIVASVPRYARFEAPGGMTLSIEGADEVAGPTLYLECADLDAIVAHLRAAGHAVSGPADQSWGWREARLTDPAGNPLCLYQAGENRRFPPWRVDA